MDSSGKSYKNHLATIRNWARRDAKREATSHKPLASNPGRREMTPEEVMENTGAITSPLRKCSATGHTDIHPRVNRIAHTAFSRHPPHPRTNVQSDGRKTALSNSEKKGLTNNEEIYRNHRR